MGVPSSDPSQAPMPSMWSIPFNGNPSDRMEAVLWCQNWADDEPQLDTTGDNLPPCPCTLQQARADAGTFEPDPWCNQDSTSEDNCRYRTKVVHCVRARRGRYVISSLLGNANINVLIYSNVFLFYTCIWTFMSVGPTDSSEWFSNKIMSNSENVYRNR